MKMKRLGESAMTMRMVLVGLVAALGVTIPTPTQCNQWWLSIRNVGSAALADWDHWKPHEKNGVQGVLDFAAPASCCGIPEADGRDAGVIAAHHMRLPKTNDVTSRDKCETWPDLPANVFETPPVVFEPLVISGELNVGVAYELNRMAEGIGIKLPPADGTESATGPGKPPGALARLAGTNKKEPASTRNRVAAEPVDAPFSRIDNLEAGLWAGLIQSAERVLAEDRDASSSTPELARLSSKLEHGFPGVRQVTLDEWIDFDGTDLIGAGSAQPVPSDREIFEDEGESIGVQDSVRSFDSVESPELMSWSEAQAYDRRDSEPSVKPVHPLKPTDLVTRPGMSSDLKQAILLTKDALNAWMNLVLRGSSFKITKR